MTDPVVPAASRRRRPGRIIALVFTLMAMAIAYTTLGLVVVQPIGAVPEGATILYWRVGLDMPFVESADGMLLERTGQVSLLGRAVSMGAMVKMLDGRRIAALPYSETLYEWTTDGQRFDR